MFNVASRGILPAQPEGKAEGKRNCNDDAGKQRLDKCLRDRELIKRRENCKITRSGVEPLAG